MPGQEVNLEAIVREAKEKVSATNTLVQEQAPSHQLKI